MRLGCGPGLYGRPGLRCFDATGDGGQGDLSVSLAYVRDGLLWCRQAGIRLYRLDGRVAPAETTTAWRQLATYQTELAQVGAVARETDLRLTFHAPLGLGLGMADEPRAAHAAERAGILAALLDGLGATDGVIVTHVGGEGGRGEGGRGEGVEGGGGGAADGSAPLLWARRALALPAGVRRRLVVEHDLAFPVETALDIHHRCGAPVVFDLLHHQLRPGRLGVREALALCLATWPPGWTPKIHLSTPRTEARLRRARGRVEARLPRPEEHADLLNPFAVMAFLRLAEGLPDFDVLLEARASDVALLRLRDELRRYASDLALRVG